MAEMKRPRNTYELIGLIKGLKPPEMNTLGQKPPAPNMLVKQQVLINILLSYINSPEVSLEVYRCGFSDALSPAILEQIGQELPPPPPLTE